MASKTLASLIVRIGADTTGVTRGMSDVQKRMRGFNSRMDMELRQTRSLFALTAGATGMGLMAKAILDAGAAVEETASKFRTVFGPATQEAQRFVDTFGTIAGLSERQAQEVLATTGAIVQGMGFAQQASASFATEVVRLAGDLSSFNNVPIAETSRAIQAALTGERESLKRLGIVLREADVQARALAMTGKLNAKALTDQEKATATLQLITERAGVAVGDLARTQSSAANQTRQMLAEIENIKDTMASSMLPALATGVGGMNDFIRGLGIMGAEAAVSVARIELAFARLGESEGLRGFFTRISGLGEGAGLFDPLGLDLFAKAVGADLGKSVSEAEANLERMRAAFDAVTFDIVGLSGALGGGAGGAGGANLTAAMGDITQRSIELTAALSQLPGLGDVTIDTFDNLTTTWGQGARAKELLNLALAEGHDVFLSVATQAEKYALTMDNLNFLLSVGALSQETFARASQAAADALNNQAAAMSKISAGLGGLGRLASIFGLAIPGLSQVSGLVGVGQTFAGMFAGGGSIPSGQWGVVGERGPEVVSGPATVTPIKGGGGGASAADIVAGVFARAPAPPRMAPPQEVARDRYWRELGAELVEALKHDGVSFN